MTKKINVDSARWFPHQKTAILRLLSCFSKNIFQKNFKENALEVLGSSVANRVFAIRLVQWLGWVFETQERKKERKLDIIRVLFKDASITIDQLEFLFVVNL